MLKGRYKSLNRQPINLSPIPIPTPQVSLEQNPYDKNVWGPDLWNILHVFSYNYPDIPSHIEKIHAKNFLTSLGFLIPCSECKEHYTMNLHRNPPEIKSRETFINWVLNLHNKVNKRHGKEMWSRNKLDKKYDTDNKYCS